MSAAFRDRFRRSMGGFESETPSVEPSDDDAGVGDGDGDGGGEWLAYELHEWSLESRVMLQQLITVDEVVHAWQGTTLMIHESLEEKVDSLVEEVEETERAREATSRPIGPEDVLTAFELAEWSEALRAELVERLVQDRVPHILHTGGEFGEGGVVEGGPAVDMGGEVAGESGVVRAGGEFGEGGVVEGGEVAGESGVVRAGGEFGEGGVVEGGSADDGVDMGGESGEVGEEQQEQVSQRDLGVDMGGEVAGESGVVRAGGEFGEGGVVEGGSADDGVDMGGESGEVGEEQQEQVSQRDLGVDMGGEVAGESGVVRAGGEFGEGGVVEGGSADDGVDMGGESGEVGEVFDLLVREADEDRVELVIDELLAREEEAQFEELDGLEVNDLLSRLFVACDRLRRDPGDLDGIRSVVTNARRIAGVRTPFGFSAASWRELRNAVGELLDLVESEDTDTEDLRESAHRMRDTLRMLV